MVGNFHRMLYSVFYNNIKWLTHSSIEFIQEGHDTIFFDQKAFIANSEFL